MGATSKETFNFFFIGVLGLSPLFLMTAPNAVTEMFAYTTRLLK